MRAKRGFRVRGTLSKLSSLEFAETAPHPNPLPAKVRGEGANYDLCNITPSSRSRNAV
jgi:hypothetical protein